MVGSPVHPVRPGGGRSSLASAPLAHAMEWGGKTSDIYRVILAAKVPL